MNIKDAVFMVVDTETTGLDPANDKLVEIAAVSVSLYGGVLGMWATLVNPGIPIPPEVSAVHYLTDSDVASAPTRSIAEYGLAQFYAVNGAHAVVAHNAAFDSGFIESAALEYLAPADWLCTQRLARHVWPEAPTFKNQGLRFWRKINVDTFGILPHRALGDALVTAAILRDLLISKEFAERGLSTVDELRLLSQSPIRITKWPRGKHFGKPLDIDISYVRWALGPTGMSDMSPDLRWSLQEVLRSWQPAPTWGD